MSSSTCGMWKRNYGAVTRGPPDEWGGNRLWVESHLSGMWARYARQNMGIYPQDMHGGKEIYDQKITALN